MGGYPEKVWRVSARRLGWRRKLNFCSFQCIFAVFSFTLVNWNGFWAFLEVSAAGLEGTIVGGIRSVFWRCPQRVLGIPLGVLL